MPKKRCYNSLINRFYQTYIYIALVFIAFGVMILFSYSADMTELISARKAAKAAENGADKIMLIKQI